MVALCFYDSKPVHFLSTEAESVTWATLTRKVWCAQEQKHVDFLHKRLQLVHDYNNHMNGADMADQLSGVYDPRGTLREKIWWRVDEWMVEERCYANAYVHYRRQCELEMEPAMPHYEFLSRAYVANINKYCPSECPPAPMPRAESTPSPTKFLANDNGGPARNTRSKPNTPAQNQRQRKRKRTVATVTNDFVKGGSCRLDRSHLHLPSPDIPTPRNTRCQVHKHVQGRGVTNGPLTKVMFCPDCRIHICLACYQPWHTLSQLQPAD
jgi:hypothetical protein